VVAASDAGSPDAVDDADYSDWLDGFTQSVSGTSRSVSPAAIDHDIFSVDSALYGGSCLDVDANFAPFSPTAKSKKMAQYATYATVAASKSVNSLSSGYDLDYLVSISGGGTMTAAVDNQFGSWSHGQTAGGPGGGSLDLPLDVEVGQVVPVGPQTYDMLDDAGSFLATLHSSTAPDGIVVFEFPGTGMVSIDVVIAGEAHTLHDIVIGSNYAL